MRTRAFSTTPGAPSCPFRSTRGPTRSRRSRPARRRPPRRRRPRVALLATGGSGALASVVGVARAMEERGRPPCLISLCSGSALFGFPIAAGIAADDVAEFTLGLRPRDYVDVDWRRLASIAPTRARGFAGIVRGDRLEATYESLLGGMTLAEMPIPAYAPIWNVEENRVEFLGPATYPNVTVARAVRMAVSLPLFIEPVRARRVLLVRRRPRRHLPGRPRARPRHTGRRRDRDQRLLSAGLRRGEHPRLGASPGEHREHCRPSPHGAAGRARASEPRPAPASMPVAMIEPVPYEKVRGLGFYRQFLNNTEWPEFMRAGRIGGPERARHARSRSRA